MVLSSIELRNFRSHKDTCLNFGSGLNYIVGGNGQGKTTILEAIYYLCTTKSFNASIDSEAVRFNEKSFEIRGNFKDLTENNIRVFYSAEENKKYYFLNDKIVSRSAEVIGKFPVVILSPADHAITQGYPGNRRKFIDSIISQASETYLKTLLDYNRTLRQRSALLSKMKEVKSRSLFEELEAWSNKLVLSGSEIINYRIKFTEVFGSFVKDSYEVILKNQELPEISYAYLDGYFGEDIEERFSELLKLRREDELRRGVNLIGPHRDNFILEINHTNLKEYGSQGQHKTFQVALRFAEFFYLKEITGKTPIFLLDDVFGELDKERSSKISSYLKQVGQAFVTLTDSTNISFNDKDLILQINEGKIAYA